MTDILPKKQPNELSETQSTAQATPEQKEINIGLIMPIAEIAGLTEHHWEDVRRVIREALNNLSGYKTNIKLVSDSDEVRVIQSNIVRNIYNNEIVIIDVSAKNPNVMFEFGMRLAFDMPFVVIKDDQTPFIFDTGNIQHLEYPRDLRYTKIEDFKNKLNQKVLSTLKYREENPSTSLYLAEYGNLVPQKIETIETDIGTYLGSIINELKLSFAKGENAKRTLDDRNLKGTIYEIIYEYDNLFEDIDSNTDFYKIKEYVSQNLGPIGEMISHYELQFLVREVLEQFINYKQTKDIPF